MPDAQEDSQSRMRTMASKLLDRVVSQTIERPMLVVSVAAGVGYVVGRGLPRWPLFGLLGVGGVAGYGLMALRARRASAQLDETKDADAGASDAGAGAEEKPGGAAAKRDGRGGRRGSRKRSDAPTVS